MNAKRTAAACLTAAGVIILCGLGTWQVQRLHWKENIIHRLEVARTQPRALSFADLRAMEADNPLPLGYGYIRGQLVPEKEVVIGPRTNKSGEIGYHLVTPVKVPGGAVLVDRGWVPENARDKNHRGHFQRGGHITFTGIVRKPDYNRFASGNNPAGDQWMRLDPGQIAQAKDIGPVAPLVLYAEETDYPITGQILNPPGWAPRNNHRQYAIFWYTMAAALAGFYAVFAWRSR